MNQGRTLGYARVSTDDQNLSLQPDALAQQGVAKEFTFTDKLSGAKDDRPGLSRCLSSLQPGDTLVVWRLDRLGRSMRHLVTLMEDLRNRGIAFQSVSDGMIDTTSPSGELVFHIFSALAQFERRLIQERTKAGLAAARARGRKGGRPPLPPNDPRLVLAKKLHGDQTLSIDDICRTLKISRLRDGVIHVVRGATRLDSRKATRDDGVDGHRVGCTIPPHGPQADSLPPARLEFLCRPAILRSDAGTLAA